MKGTPNAVFGGFFSWKIGFWELLCNWFKQIWYWQKAKHTDWLHHKKVWACMQRFNMSSQVPRGTLGQHLSLRKKDTSYQISNLNCLSSRLEFQKWRVSEFCRIWKILIKPSTRPSAQHTRRDTHTFQLRSILCNFFSNSACKMYTIKNPISNPRRLEWKIFKILPSFWFVLTLNLANLPRIMRFSFLFHF